ncbi:MCE family protein [Jatrophihabitans sp.]|uniref:MCE family protein n=1 Tax=Jatrophihabitans sp. TaxID=1932789 RepID=UPI0030C6F3A1|nr:Phospholipid/cholesterol/gamma-HCH transport system substrate-binding protein [Jatrophihabitans sp.]
MKSFNERNPVIIAVVGLVALVGVGLLTFYSNSLPLLTSSTTYTADFHDASGLQSGDDVRVAGVKVGSVDSISLSGGHVRVVFDVSGTWIGDRTTAGIKIKTLLGQEYLGLSPQGTAAQNPDRSIPTSRTSTPIDVAQALSGLATTTGDIDTTQLAKSFETLSEAFANTPNGVRTTLQGLSALSETIASRDSELRQLAGHAKDVTAVLVGNNANVTSLVNDGKLLLAELQSRSAAITRLLSGTRTFAASLAGIVTDNQKTIGPALAQLKKVTDILNANQGNVDKALQLIGPYFSMINDAAGNGHWLDVYICGLFDAQDNPVLNNQAQRNCTPPGATK